MRWASALVTDNEFEKGISNAADRIRASLDGLPPHLVTAFVSTHHRRAWDALPHLLDREFPQATCIGCSAGGVIGQGRELEDAAGIGISAAHLPGVEVSPIRLDIGHDATRSEAVKLWQAHFGGQSHASPVVLVFPEPFSSEPQTTIEALDEAVPGVTTIGGLPSGGRRPGENMIMVDGQVVSSGVASVILRGNIHADTVVAQGCRPIGQPMFVTGCEGPVLAGLDGIRPVEVLHELFDDLTERDQDLLRYSLLLGVVMRGDETQYRHGDFLIRNVMGFDPDSGSLAVGADLKEGLVVQFHLRDAEASTDDLHSVLDTYRRSNPRSPAGGLLFSCLGRGSNLYGRANHDSELFTQYVGDVPLSGFFCNGEIGPVQESTYIHGYTSVFALFSPRD